MSDSDEPMRPVYKSPAKQWDVFLSHASEDKPYVRALADVLKAAGLTVFIDEHDLVIGRSLRAQIDHALLNSHLGVLFISPHFLKKRWPREEFDALFALEDDGRTRMLPIWLNLGKAEVAEYSPMLASRLALPADVDPTVTGSQIVRHIHTIYNEEGSWGQLVRIDTLCLPWVQRPRFLNQSLKMLDDFFLEFWKPWETGKPNLPTSDAAPALRVGDLIVQAVRFDGHCVIVTGRQEAVQLYESRGKLAEYVFQLRTNDPVHKNSILYVRYVDDDQGAGELPRAPDTFLTTAMGVAVASGAVTLSNGLISNCAYMIAAKVYHRPPIT